MLRRRTHHARVSFSANQVLVGKGPLRKIPLGRWHTEYRRRAKAPCMDLESM